MTFYKEIIHRILDATEVMIHKLAFIYIWGFNKSLRHHISVNRVLKHDTQKVIDILLMGDNMATKKHRKEEGHHTFKTVADLWEAVCDWECAHITKPAKPLKARSTWETYYKHLPLKSILDNANL